MALGLEKRFRINLLGERVKKTDKVPRTVAGTLRRDIPILAAGVGLDLASSEIITRAGGIEAGPGSALVMFASHNFDPLGLPTLVHQGSGILLASALSYGFSLLFHDRKDKIFSVNLFMLGLTGIHVLAAMNNIWDLEYAQGHMPISGPLDGLRDLGLTGFLNFLDWWSPEPGAK